MAVGLADVKRRIGVTRQIRKVCGTLQKVAAARLTRELKFIAQSDLYFERVCSVLSRVCAELPDGAAAHPLMVARDEGPVALVVLGADRGLCGSFNSGLMSQLASGIEAHAREPVVVVASGRVVQRRVSKLAGVAVVPVDGIEAVEAAVVDGFLSGRFRSVELLYWHYRSGSRQELVQEPLLPCVLQGVGSGLESGPAPLVEPGPAAVVDRMLPAYVRAKVRGSFHHSAVSEHAQRQMSMGRATENAGEMLDGLTKSYRRLRQESITTEILELIGGLGAGTGRPGGHGGLD
jgi:F-type H+-transporting ATPase subunit gamma